MPCSRTTSSRPVLSACAANWTPSRAGLPSTCQSPRSTRGRYNHPAKLPATSSSDMSGLPTAGRRRIAVPSRQVARYWDYQGPSIRRGRRRERNREIFMTASRAGRMPGLPGLDELAAAAEGAEPGYLHGCLSFRCCLRGRGQASYLSAGMNNEPGDLSSWVI
jgi:hypothetical protein